MLVRFFGCSDAKFTVVNHELFFARDGVTKLGNSPINAQPAAALNRIREVLLVWPAATGTNATQEAMEVDAAGDATAVDAGPADDAPTDGPVTDGEATEGEPADPEPANPDPVATEDEA